MTRKDAIGYLREIMDETDIKIQELADLVTWAYDKGWTEGISDYKEEQACIPFHEWRKSYQ